jgi:hypothetical protein
VTFTQVLTVYHSGIHPPPSFSFILSPSSPKIVSTGPNFPFTYMCIQYLHHIYPPILSPLIFPSPTGTNPVPRIQIFRKGVLCEIKFMHGNQEDLLSPYTTELFLLTTHVNSHQAHFNTGPRTLTSLRNH